jgi:hypothetical protein
LKRSTDAEQGFNGNGSSRLDLLPMTRREAIADHVLLWESLSLANLANATAESTEECGIIEHAPVLLGDEQKHHEQNSVYLMLERHRKCLIVGSWSDWFSRFNYCRNLPDRIAALHTFHAASQNFLE